MALISEARARVLVVLVVCSVLVAMAAVAALVAVVVWSGSDDEEGLAPALREAVVVEDLCVLVQPAVPDEFVLDHGRSTNDSRDGAERATCLFGSSGTTMLEVRVTSYDLPEGDPYGTLDQLVGAACDAMEQRYAAGFTDDLAGGCSARDSSETSQPVLTTATKVASLPHLDAVVSVALTDLDLPARVAAYASAITYGVVASDLTR